MLIPVLLTALAAASAPSAEGPDQDSVVTTAPATPAVLAGAEAPVAPTGYALDYERQLARPEGPPNRRSGVRPAQAAEE